MSEFTDFLDLFDKITMNEFKPTLYAILILDLPKECRSYTLDEVAELYHAHMKE